MKNSAFCLIEMLAALSLFFIIILALVDLQSEMMVFQKITSQQFLAQSLLQEKISSDLKDPHLLVINSELWKSEVARLLPQGKGILVENQEVIDGKIIWKIGHRYHQFWFCSSKKASGYGCVELRVYLK